MIQGEASFSLPRVCGTIVVVALNNCMENPWILEKMVSVQINSFLKENNILEEFQSDFRTHHNTKTVLIKIISDLRFNSDENKVLVLALLDLQ